MAEKPKPLPVPKRPEPLRQGEPWGSAWRRPWPMAGLGLVIMAVGLGGLAGALGWLGGPESKRPAPPRFIEALSDPAPATAAAPDGAFRFQYVKGESLRYRLEAAIGGTGQEDIGPGLIDMRMQSDLVLETTDTGPRGQAAMAMRFENTALEGDFMDAPFVMTSGVGGRDYINDAGRVRLDAPGGAAPGEGTPQTAFFNTPIEFDVDAQGDVSNIRGPAGIEALLAQTPIASELDFPDGALAEGEEWTSDFQLPIPGFAQAAEATIHNRFLGYDTFNGQRVGVIHQRIASKQRDGQLDSPGGAFGESMGFSMPNFELAGENRVYFDVENGRMVHTDMALRVRLAIGQALGGAGAALDGLLTRMGGLVNEDLPEFENFGKKAPGQENLLDLDLTVQARMGLAAVE